MTTNPRLVASVLWRTPDRLCEVSCLLITARVDFFRMPVSIRRNIYRALVLLQSFDGGGQRAGINTVVNLDSLLRGSPLTSSIQYVLGRRSSSQLSTHIVLSLEKSLHDGGFAVEGSVGCIFNRLIQIPDVVLVHVADHR